MLFLKHCLKVYWFLHKAGQTYRRLETYAFLVGWRGAKPPVLANRKITETITLWKFNANFGNFFKMIWNTLLKYVKYVENIIDFWRKFVHKIRMPLKNRDFLSFRLRNPEAIKSSRKINGIMPFLKIFMTYQNFLFKSQC